MSDDKHKSAPFPTDGNKLLLVIRHAKSSWEVGTLNDFERPLNERGKKDAPVMAKRLIDRKIMIDAFVSSPAKRAKKTAELFCETYGKSEDSILYVSKLYQAEVDPFYQVVEQLDDFFNTVAIFSHNPGITDFVNTLREDEVISNMPTGSVFAVQIHLKKWADFRKAKKEFLFFDYPKLV
ncbi:MAG: histidine phosphatase family protein [Ferruginibacter sp.]|nr:histidine phosphatase family protein [Ferruginibacter sp.]